MAAWMDYEQYCSPSFYADEVESLGTEVEHALDALAAHFSKIIQDLNRRVNHLESQTEEDDEDSY